MGFTHPESKMEFGKNICKFKDDNLHLGKKWKSSTFFSGLVRQEGLSRMEQGQPGSRSEDCNLTSSCGRCEGCNSFGAKISQKNFVNLRLTRKYSGGFFFILKEVAVEEDFHQIT